MLVTCPRCKRSLSTADPESPPAFCMYCGQKLRDNSGTRERGGMLTASHVPFTDNPEEDTAEPPPSEVGGFRLIRFLGSGGMGTVYEAEALESGQRVAVKLLSTRLASNPSSVERFRQEGRLASQLSHPRCVFVLAADTDAGRPYIVMELMPGRTLKDLLDADGPLPPNDAIAHILDVIEGLAEAHRLGVLHRDVKPSNCFLTADGRVKIGDFGLSKSLAASADHHLTQSGAFLGTVLFASPEQIRGEPLDYGSDVYSVCATLYYLLCGEAPYHHESATAALAKAISEDPPPICARQPNVSRALERIVMRGLERDRERRWQSLDELREALVDLLPSKQTPARPRALLGACLLDWLILVLLVVIPLEVLHSLLQWPHVEVSGVIVDPVEWALAIAYFATFEGLLGRTPGKSLLGLRVSRVGQSGPPGLERGWVRAAAFAMLWFWTFYSPAILGRMLGSVPAIVAVAIGGFALLLQFRRTAGGFRGIHDFLSGCHVTQKPLPVRRLRLLSRHPNPLDDVLPSNDSEPLPATLGGYAVKGRLWVEPVSGEQVWSAEDRVLGRRILVWLMPDDGNPSTPIANEVPRPTRLRRLGRGTLRWSGRDLEWVAFAAPVGVPLTDTIRRPISWADSRFVLEQVAEELEAAEADGSLPDRLSLNQVWVEPNGRVQLLDFPMLNEMNGSSLLAGRASDGLVAPSLARPANKTNDANTSGRPLDLLRQVASLMLEGRPRSGVEDRATIGIRAPVPPHAAPLFVKLFAPRGYSSLTDFRCDLEQTHAHAPEVTPAIRTAHLGIQAALLSLGLFVMFVEAGGVGVQLAITTQRHVVEAEATLADLRDPSKHEELKRIQGAASAIDNPRAIGRIEAFRVRKQAEAKDRRGSLLAPQRFVVEEFDRAMADVSPDRTAILRAEHDLLVWSATNEKMPAGRGASPWEYRESALWFAMLLVPLMWIVAAAAFRGGFSMMIAGIAVVRTDGRRAYRRQCAFRAAIVWLPITALLIGCVWLQVYHYRAAYLAAGFWLAAAVLLPVYVVLALRYPSRPPQDRIVGTHLVPA